MTNTFFTSDTHFNHKNILIYTKRGEVWKTVEEMNAGLRDNWNKTVPVNGTVYMMGDVCFWYKPELLEEYMKGLNGTKHLILGNHDQMISRKSEYLLASNTFASIQSYKEIKLDDNKICLFHFAPRIWNRAHKGSWCLWGHSHGELEPYGKSVDVGIDSPWVTGKPEHRPFSYEEVKTFMQNRDLVKHHKVDND